MYEVFQPKIYSLLFKESRKKHNLKTSDIATLSSYSTGSINLFENCNDILNNKKVQYLSSFYHLDYNNILNLNENLNITIKNFYDSIIKGETVDTTDSFIKLDKTLSEFKHSIIHNIYDMIKWVYCVYTRKLEGLPKLENVEKILPFLTDKYKAFCYIYIGQYYLMIKKFTYAKKYYDTSFHYLSENEPLLAMYHYCLASYYVRINNIPSSITHCEEAVSIFTKLQNVRRLINTNIIIGNQYLKLRNYELAFDINVRNLDYVDSHNLVFEKRVCLNNIAFIYMMKNQFKQAIPYFEKMPKEFVEESHLYSYMICLGEVDEFDKGKSICLEGKNIANTPYFKYMFKIYNNYFEDRNLKKLSRNIEKVFEKYDDYLDSFEKEFLCVLLGNQYKRSGNIKKALEYFEKLHELSYS